MSHESRDTKRKQIKKTASEMPIRQASKQEAAFAASPPLIILHAYAVTLVLSCARSRCLRFKD